MDEPSSRPPTTTPRTSRFAFAAFLAAQLGMCAGVVAWGLVLFAPFLSEGARWSLAFGGPLLFTLYGLVVWGLNALAVGRVLASGDRGPGLLLPFMGLWTSLAVALPGTLLGASVVVILWMLFSRPGGFGNPGRPLHLGGGPWSRTVVLRGLRRVRSPRPGVALAWLRATAAERSAVGAFRQLARDLAAHGAPAALVGRCSAAAAEETDHAARCADLVARFGGLEAGFAPIPQVPPQDLAAIAVSSWVDGVVGEGFAAAVARAAARAVGDPEVAALLRDVARDEASHAALSRDVLAWCTRRGGAPVRSALLAATLSGPAALPTTPLAGGVPGPGQRRLRRRVLRRAAAPLLAT